MKKLFSLIFIGMACNAIAQTNVFPPHGNVGIGTNAPIAAARLTLRGATDTSAGIFMNGPGQSTGLYIGQVLSSNYNDFDYWNAKNGYVRFGTNNTERMKITSAGDVGIGASFPSARLTVVKHNSSTVLPGQSSFGTIHLASAGNNSFTGITGSGGFYENTTQVGILFQSGTEDPDRSTKIHFMTADDYSVGMKDRMVIDQVGKVGIGTILPSVPLEVKHATLAAARLNTVATNGSTNFSYAENGTLMSQIFTIGTTGSTFGGASSFNLYNAQNAPIVFYTNGNNERMRILGNGNVGIGTATPGAYMLNVCGEIRANDVIINLTGCDFVFEDTYKLRPIYEVEKFIKANKRLPEIAPAAEMERDGTNLSEMNSKLLQKVEELTLYVIDLQKQNDALNKRVGELEKK